MLCLYGRRFLLHKVNFKFHHYIFLLEQLVNLEQLKLSIKQSSPIPHVASENRQIFHCVLLFLDFMTIYIYGRNW